MMSQTLAEEEMHFQIDFLKTCIQNEKSGCSINVRQPQGRVSVVNMFKQYTCIHEWRIRNVPKRVKRGCQGHKVVVNQRL